jgi:rubrerythrin
LKKCGLVIIGTVLLLTLVGCRQPESFDEILYAYDRIADNEAIIADAHQEIHNRIEKENELRVLIIDGGADNNLAVLTYIEEMLESIHTRQVLIEEQIRVMNESKEELEAIDQRVEAIENEEIKWMFLRVQTLHRQRYESFMGLRNHNLETISIEIQFYTQLLGEEQNLEELENMTVELNQRAITEGELQEELTQVSNRLNGAINALAGGL